MASGGVRGPLSGVWRRAGMVWVAIAWLTLAGTFLVAYLDARPRSVAKRGGDWMAGAAPPPSRAAGDGGTREAPWSRARRSAGRSDGGPDAGAGGVDGGGTGSQGISGRFVYAFVVSGCDRESCLGYVLNAVATAHALRRGGSRADIAFVVHMAAGHDRLPGEQAGWLTAAGMRLRYLERTEGIVNFGMATLNKFRILQATEYDRVLFLDADILPLCNMDYMFEESYKEEGLFEDDVVMEGSVAPMTASMFLLKPRHGAFKVIMDLVREYRRTHDGAQHFDGVNGWGHEIVAEADRWEAKGMRKDGYLWNYKAAHSDQGLLHHWIKYIVMNYTQLKVHSIQTWSEVTHNPAYGNFTSRAIANVSSTALSIAAGAAAAEHGGEVATNIAAGASEKRVSSKTAKRGKADKADQADQADMHTIIVAEERAARQARGAAHPSPVIPVGDKFLTKTGQVPASRLSGCGGGQTSLDPPYSDFYHYSGPRKPWLQPIRAGDIPPKLPRWSKDSTDNDTILRRIWLYHLGRANGTFGLGLPSDIEVHTGKFGNPFGADAQDNHLLGPDVMLPTR